MPQEFEQFSVEPSGGKFLAFRFREKVYKLGR